MSETPPQGPAPSNPPPASASPDPYGLGPTSMGMAAHVAGALSYIFGWITGLIFFLAERDNKFVRFHAMQSILLSLTFIVLWFIFYVLLIPMLLSGLGGLLLLMPFVWLLGFALVIVCIVQAATGKWFKLPLIGEIAMKQSGGQG
jgi:uncharacterized membrane protein